MHNLKHILPVYLNLLWDVRRQKVFMRKFLEPAIMQASSTNDGTLDHEDISKIRNYYGFGVPAIVGEGFCTLRGKPMTAAERAVSTCQGALTGLFDDFFDKTKFSHDDIKLLMHDPQHAGAGTSLEKLFIYFLSKVHEGLPDKPAFEKAFAQVFEAQARSLSQLDPGITWDDIGKITFRKGGVSLLFYRSAFSHKLRKGEEEALYHAGSLMQLGNDIFDTWKDERQHVRTLLTSCSKIDEVRKVFDARLVKTIGLVKITDYAESQKKNFLHKFVLGISRCWVCLDQLEQLQQKTGGNFKVSDYSREELICDMEKPANMLSSIRYYLNYRI